MTSSAPRGAAFPLGSLPTREFRGTLSRCVPYPDFASGDPPRFFFVSGNANRLNPEGVRCLYLSEEERIADAEYGGYWQGLPSAHQPKLTFHVRVELANVLDLAMPEVLDALGLREADLFGTWRLSPVTTRLQALGKAIAGQTRIVAVRYPSTAARSLSPPGYNLAVFVTSLKAPDRLEVLGKHGKVLETLPEESQS